MNQTYEIEVFYDGDCPLCLREVGMLRRLDRQERIRFTDISKPGFQPAHFGKSMADLMARIHGQLPDGTWVEGVEVFRHLYRAVGFGPLVTVTRLPIVSHLLEWGYRVFARNRLKWTGRCTTGTCATT